MFIMFEVSSAYAVVNHIVKTAWKILKMFYSATRVLFFDKCLLNANHRRGTVHRRKNTGFGVKQ